MSASPKHPSSPSQAKIIVRLLLLAAILGGLGYWWYTTLEWEDKEIDLGYAKEAQQNDFLAAEIFLRNHGIQAITVKNLSLLDKHRWRNIELGHNDTLVLINANKTLDEERYNSLYEWIENGGTLITSTQNPFIGTHTRKEDLLLSDFGITPAEDSAVGDAIDLLERFSDGPDDDKKPTAEKSRDDNNTDNNVDTRDNPKDTPQQPENYSRCSLAEAPTEIEFTDEEKPLRFDFTRRAPFIYHYHDNTDEATGNPTEDDTDSATDITGNTDEDIGGENDATEKPEEKHLIYFAIGEGAITVTSDNYIWSNRRIDCHDHAYALWSLVNPNGRVWFLVNQDAPSLALIIWNQARYAVLAGLLALLLWLWASGARFGPIFVVPQQGRRSLAEHIYASAMLLWRKQQHPQLVKLLREEIFARLAQQLQPDGNAQQELDFLHSLTGLSQADLQQALFTENLIHPQDFTRAIAHLQLIRKHL